MARRMMRAAVVAALLMVQAAAEFNYDPASDEGPKHWKKKWAECAGNRQSPIDFDTDKMMMSEGRMEFMKTYVPNMKLYDAKLANVGHGIKLSLDKSNITTASSSFPDLQQLLQYHYHTPSEHTIDGEHYPAELHLVHQPWDREISGSRAPTVVLGFMVKEAEDDDYVNALLDQVLEYKDDLKAKDDEKEIHLAPMVPWCTNWMNYQGSFTTPPCSEIVDWWVCKEPMMASKDQLEALKAVVDLAGKGTNRPTQPLNGRRVGKVWTGDMAKIKKMEAMMMMMEKEMEGQQGGRGGRGGEGPRGGEVAPPKKGGKCSGGAGGADGNVININFGDMAEKANVN